MKKRFEKILNHEHKWIILFSLIMLIVYLLTLSCSFDDEDSIFFVKGLEEFNVSKYQPHPPGYPVYIFFGKIFNLFISDEFLGLGILSAVSGGLCLIVFYFLILKMFNKKTALMSAVILGVTPLFWLNSLKAMSDVTGLFFILLSMYFIYSFIKDKKARDFYLGSFISAIAIGVRFHALFILVPLLIYAVFKNRTNRDERFKGKISYGFLLFCSGILIWFIPMLAANGIMDYFNSVFGQFFYISSDTGSSVLSAGFSIGDLGLRVISFLRFFLGAGYGIELFDFSVLQVLFLFLYMFFLFLSFERLKNNKILFFILGLVFYLGFTFFFLSAHNPRYLLPLIPFISLLFALGISFFERFDYLGFLFLVLLLLINSFPLALEIHKTPSSPQQLIDYINEKHDLDEVVIFTDSMTGRYFRYYGLEFYRYSKLEDYSLKNLSEGKEVILFVNPNDNFVEIYNVSLIKSFKRDFRVHPKHNLMKLYEIVQIL